jgi:signal transduction histidine kinase
MKRHYKKAANPLEEQEDWGKLRQGIIGLGESSSRKSYYPELQKRLDELVQTKASLATTNRQLDGINRLQHSLLKATPLEAKLTTITDGLVRYFRADFCRIWLIRPGDCCAQCVHAKATNSLHLCRQHDKCLHLLASSGRYTHTNGQVHKRIPFGCYKIGKIASGSEHKFLIDDVVNNPFVHNNDWASKLGLASFAGYQLRPPGGESIGVLALFSQHPILPSEDAMLDSLSSAVALAIQQVAAEDALRRANEELEARVEQRTLQFTHANEQLRDEITERKILENQLQRKNENLERSNAELEQFAYVASHDLQEPLRKVGSYMELVVERYRDQLDQDAREFIDYAVDGARRMKIMIDDLLKYSRVVTQGKTFAPTDLMMVMHDVLNDLELAIEENDAAVSYDCLPVVTADNSQLQLLFRNLIGNALKYRGEKPPRIHVCAQRQEQAWKFYVKDNGIGIEQRFFERIFQIFQRLHPRAQYEGTGIGLAVCQKIVERHGGAIWVESTPGRGSTFYFTIPDLNEGI